MMKIAIPNWQDRISPVFDVARNILLVDLSNAREQGRSNVVLEAEGFQSRVEALVRYGTDVLICGAISRPMEDAIVSAGVKVIPQICGPIEQVLEAFIKGRLDQDSFIMPGCCGRRRGFQGRGQGTGRGLRRGGAGRGGGMGRGRERGIGNGGF